MMFWLSGVAALLGYLLGSLPTAYLAARRAAGNAAVDIRRLGDGNPGAGNIGQLYGGRWGYFVGAVDILKGAVPVFAADLLVGLAVPDGSQSRALSPPAMLAGVGAVAGHIWPVWLRGRGGRGAATAVGVTGAVLTGPVLLMAPPAFILLLVSRSATLALAFICIASLVAARAFFGAGWTPLLYCAALFIAAGAAHLRSARIRPAATTTMPPAS